MSSTAQLDRIGDAIVKGEQYSVLITETIEDKRDYVITIDCYNEVHEKCISEKCGCECHKPEVKQMPASKEIIEPKDWSLDRKQAELEKQRIVIPDNLPINSDERRLFVESEFEKLDMEVLKMGIKKEVKTKNGKENKTKLICSKCKEQKGYIVQRQLNKFGNVENTLKTYECKKCRKEK